MKDKKDINNCTQEEKDRIVGAFQWLIEEDRRQNPHLYIKKDTLEKGQTSEDNKSK